MYNLIAVVLTKNEIGNIEACIASLQHWVDAVVVWDSGSTDGTQWAARRAGAFVVQRPFDNYAAQRQAALTTVAAEWILFVDADERVPRELADEIVATLVRPQQRPEIGGYWLPRRNFIAGNETRAGGFYPDYQLRLLKRALAHYVPEREVHEIVEIDGGEEYLEQPLLHFNYEDWGHFHRKQPTYARYEARILASRGIRPKAHNFILQPLREFRRRYFQLSGYRDGLHGLQLALWLAWYYGFLPYWYLLSGQV